MRLMDLHGEGPGYVGCCSDVLRQRKIAPSPTLVCCDLPLPVCRHASAACTHPQPIFRLVSACLSCACSLHTIIRTCSGVRLGAQFGFRLSTWLGTGLGFDWRRHQGRVRHRALHRSLSRALPRAPVQRRLRFGSGIRLSGGLCRRLCFMIRLCLGC
jgi:hypothetical protein